MKGTKACAGRDDPEAPLTTVPDVGHDFTRDVVVVLSLAKRFVFRVDLVIEPAFPVDAVYGKDFDLAGFDRILDRVDNIEALVLEKIGRRRREHQQRESKVAIGHDLHGLVQAWAVPAVDESLHSMSSFVLAE